MEPQVSRVPTRARALILTRTHPRKVLPRETKSPPNSVEFRGRSLLDLDLNQEPTH